MLISFGGLPGTGKSTIARAVAERLGATYLRIDTIEQAIRSAGVLAGGIEGAGYAVARDLAATNLSLGLTVIVDSVNPLTLTREMFRTAARESGAGLLEIEVVCRDLEEHRRRVETRIVDVEGLKLPTWEEVSGRTFEPWPDRHLVLDTSELTPKRAIEMICGAANLPPGASPAYRS